MKAVIDTNVLIYDRIEDSIFHEEARKKLDELENWFIPSVVIEEFVFVLTQLNVNKNIIGKMVEEILTNKKAVIIPLEKIDVSNATSFILSEATSFKKFNDKLILSVAKRKNAPLFTFDSELKKEGKKHKINFY